MVFGEADSCVVSAVLENLVGGRVENLAREKERGNQAQDCSTAQEVAISAQAEKNVEALEAGQEVYDEDSGPHTLVLLPACLPSSEDICIHTCSTGGGN